MAKPFRFRYVNQIAGAFTAVIVILLVSGFIVAGHAQGWFENVRKILINMPVAGTYGIKEGAEIRMLGTAIGTVDKVDIDPESGQVRALCHLKANFAKAVSRDSSHTIIHIPIALADPYIEITRGTGGRPLPADADRTVYLTAQPEVGAGDTINQTLEEVRQKTLPKINALLDQYTQLAVDLRDPKGSVQGTLSHIDHLTAQFEQTDNIVGRLLNDKKMADDISAAVEKLTASADNIQMMLANLKKTTDELPGIAHAASAEVNMLPPMIDQTREMLTEVKNSLHDLQQSTQQLPAIVGSLKTTVDQLPDVMLHVQQTLIEVQKLVKGMEGLPFIRDSVPQSQGGQPLRPSDIGASP